MAGLYFGEALLNSGWATGVRIEIAGGLIGAVRTGTLPDAGDERQAISPPNYPHTEATREVAESLYYALLSLGHDAILTTRTDCPVRRLARLAWRWPVRTRPLRLERPRHLGGRRVHFPISQAGIPHCHRRIRVPGKPVATSPTRQQGDRPLLARRACDRQAISPAAGGNDTPPARGER
jgi:hypothetical protein